MNKIEKILWGVKIGEPDYMEELITNNSDQIEQAKVWAVANGFDRLRVAEINLNEKPDFAKTINTK